MPLKNYHSARILKPTFKKYITKQLGGGITLLLGIKDGYTVTQSIRFDSTKFTEKEAEDWLKKHNKKYISFFPAMKINEEDSAMTTTSDIATYSKKVLPTVTRFGDLKKKTIRETIEWVIDESTNIN